MPYRGVDAIRREGGEGDEDEYKDADDSEVED